MDFLKLMNFGWLSQASYRDLSVLTAGDPTGLADELKSDREFQRTNKFAAEQASGFVDPVSGFSFIDHYPNDLVGFSATVFKSNADDSYTLAVRGTESNSIVDLFAADVLGVAFAGKAREQAIAAYRYYKQLTTVPGQSVVYSDTG